MSKVMDKEEIKGGGAVGAGEANEAVKAIRIEWKRVFDRVAVRVVGVISKREFAEFAKIQFKEKEEISAFLMLKNEICIRLVFGCNYFSLAHNRLDVPDDKSGLVTILVSCGDFAIIRKGMEYFNEQYAKFVAGCDGIPDEGSI